MRDLATIYYRSTKLQVRSMRYVSSTGLVVEDLPDLWISEIYIFQFSLARYLWRVHDTRRAGGPGLQSNESQLLMSYV